MYALIEDEWSDEYLDYFLGEEKVRVDVYRWAVLEEVTDQYITYSLSDWRKALNYVQKIGVANTIRKILSRVREGGRNRKWMSVGLGPVEDSHSQSERMSGDWVVFAACNHPRCVDRVVVDERFTCQYAPSENTDSTLEFFDHGALDLDPGSLSNYAGWSPHSGWPVACDEVKEDLTEIGRQLDELERGGIQLGVRRDREVEERRIRPDHKRRSPLTASLFGLGNYAKTVIVPNLSDSIEVTTVHEVDPIQLGPASDWDVTVDTAPRSRPDENYEVALVAGFHHSHTPIALEALKRGAAAIVEKPLCTTADQLHQLAEVMRGSEDGRLFAGFHKRYSKLNEWLGHDVDLESGDPLHYHCLVYEIPLPRLHWYNWPASRTRMVSNGCHWVDHFMYLNNYVEVRDWGVRKSTVDDIKVDIELENDASFSMVLTDRGSSRLGVREYVEVRTKTVTAQMVDNERYQSETDSRILQKKKTSRTESYERMYSGICRKILRGDEGESPRQLRSTRTVLEIDARLSELDDADSQTG